MYIKSSVIVVTTRNAIRPEGRLVLHLPLRTTESAFSRLGFHSMKHMLRRLLTVKDVLQSIELCQAQQEQAYRDLARSECDEKLERVEVVVLQVIAIDLRGKIMPVLADSIADFCHNEALSDGCDHPVGELAVSIYYQGEIEGPRLHTG